MASDHSLVVDVAAWATAQPPVEPLPRVQSLACPYPDPGRDPHYDRHQILDHENIKVRLQLLVVIYLAQILTIGVLQPRLTLRQPPCGHPGVARRLFIEIARNHDSGWYRVEHRENAYTDHEFLKLVSLCTVRLHYGADLEERDETGKEERCSNDQVQNQRSNHEPSQGVDVRDAHKADAAQDVSVNLSHGENGDCLDGRDGPGGKVEILGVCLDRFMAPLHSCSQEPGQGQDDPPDRGSHTEEVQQHEQNCTPLFLCALSDEGICLGNKVLDLVFIGESAAGIVILQEESYHICQSNHEVTSREEDDGSLRVPEPLHVNQES